MITDGVNNNDIECEDNDDNDDDDDDEEEEEEHKDEGDNALIENRSFISCAKFRCRSDNDIHPLPIKDVMDFDAGAKHNKTDAQQCTQRKIMTMIAKEGYFYLTSENGKHGSLNTD
ncbi:hypothetical protein ElyMa_004035100 [Elysia marginata]|uniref:Uncharacterized protein n=1 Tax=Elysia marginata TaxID=1093978 RepID=A0AAV4G326_9GAST|nr:hypothetical protein ElyMa_004035100 [Elysia marginata]